jgi:tetratricopeptide (TPR) repeat protein
VGSRSEGDFIDLGLEHEREGRRLQAMASYGDGLERYPDSFGLLAARGRMAVDLQRFAEARPLLERARLRSPSDPQVLHALGLALAAEGDERGARTAFESARSFPAFRSAASLELSRLDARQGRLEAAQARLRGVAAAQPDAVRVGGLEVALLRGLGRADEAMRRLPPWHELDPTSTFLRHEALLLGAQDEGLLVHLAAEPERVLGLAAEYMGLGFWADALAVLERTYPEPPPGSVEPGNLLPQHHPLVGYFRGYCRERTGGSAASDFGAASAMSTRYVFPSRPETFVVLRRALEIDPDDATALLLLGSLHLAGGEVDAAVALWQRARPSARRLPVLHRNLGLTLLHARHDPAAALEVFREGMGADPRNAALYAGADVAASLAGLKAAERVALLERFPDRASLPPALVYKLALALVEVGRAEEAERLFHGRFFPREEGGTNVRQVFLEVRLRRALELAQAGRAKEAAALVASLDRPVKGLTFTQDGLAEFLDTSRLRLLRGDVLSAAGRPQAARAEWERARDGGEGALLRPVHLALAQRRLGEGDPAKEKAALEQALSRAEAVLAQGTSAPGIVVYAQGVTLLALGRDVEAQEALRRVLLLPDVRLSHFLARQALEGKESR